MSSILITQPAPITRRLQITSTIGYYLVFITLGLVAVSFGPTLPGLAEHTQTRLNQISFVFAAKALGGMLGSFWLGRLFDRLPGHQLMTILLGLFMVTMALIPILPNIWLLTLVLLLLGIAEGALHVGNNTLPVWVHGSKVGPFLTGGHFFFGVGAFLSPLIIAHLMLRSGDIIWPYWALALLMFPSIVWLMRLPSPIPVTDSKEHPARPVNPLLLALLMLFFFLYVGLEVSFSGWIFTYTVTLGISGEATAAYLTSAFWGAVTLFRLLAIPIAARFRPRIILFTDLIGGVGSIAIMLLWSTSLTAVWVGTVGLGIFMASVFPTTIALAERRMPITGKITGWFLVAGSLGAMSIPWLVGQLFEPIGPQVMPVIIMIMLTIALGVLTALMSYSPAEA